MRTLAAKVRTPAGGVGRALAAPLWLLLMVVGLLAGGCARKVNQTADGRYVSAREMAVLRKAERQRHKQALREEKARAAHQREYAASQRAAPRRPAPVRSAPPATTRPALPADQQTRELIRIARTYTGTPYRVGGTTRLGMDCSGLISTTFQEAGLDLPRTSGDQSSAGTELSQRELRAGDLVFFATDGGGSSRISHVGMVTEARGPAAGDVQFIHASSSLGVKEDNLKVAYWQRCYVKAVRPHLVPRSSVVATAPVAGGSRPTIWQLIFGR